MRVAATGAAGHLGGLVARGLLDRVDPGEVVLITRRPERLPEDLKASGADIRFGDFDLPESLAAAFAGVERAMIVSTDVLPERYGDRLGQHVAGFEGAREAGVGHLVFPSMPGVDEDHPSGLHALEYLRSEEALKALPGTWTILQNAPYDHYILMRGKAAVGSGELTSNAGAGRVAPIAHEDCAAVAVEAILDPRHENSSYVVTGPELFDHRQLAALFAEIAGRAVEVVEFADEDHPARLRADGVPDPFPVYLSAHLKAVRLGYFDEQTSTVEDLTGRPAIPLRVMLEAHRDELMGSSQKAR